MKNSGANDPKAITNQGHILNIKNVINHLNGDSPLLIDGYEARKSVEIINAIYESAKTNKWISL